MAILKGSFGNFGIGDNSNSQGSGLNEFVKRLEMEVCELRERLKLVAEEARSCEAAFPEWKVTTSTR